MVQVHLNMHFKILNYVLLIFLILKIQEKKNKKIN